MHSFLIGRSSHIESLRGWCARYGPRRRSVVIRGETGTGKYVVAQELHRCSGRGEFVRIAAAEVRPGGFEQSLLAGKSDDAYSGSRRASEGLLRFAAGGTVFLDDVQDLATEVQSYLLDVIEGKPLRAKGELRTFDTNVRWLFGTQRPLEELVAEGFKRDLAARMGRVGIVLLPLREHLEDVAPLSAFLLRRIAGLEQLEQAELSSRTLQALTSYWWPDNVRELEEALYEALIEAAGEGSAVIEPRHLPERLRGRSDRAGPGRPQRVSLEAALDSLDSCDWIVVDAARKLGVEPRTIFRKLKTHGIARPKSRARQGTSAG